MIEIRHRDERGLTRNDWLESRHTFSFDQYRDPRYMGLRNLRVINEDWIAPGAGFPEHGHHDMEIITYVLEGLLDHKDSTGAASSVLNGDVQRMSAGTGLTHSESNHSQTEPVHLLQIWLRPVEKGLAPSYEQNFFPIEDKWGRFCLIASPDGRQGSLTIHSDAFLYATAPEPGESITHELATERHAWVQVTRGVVSANGVRLECGDGAAISGETQVEITGVERGEALLFDLG